MTLTLNIRGLGLQRGGRRLFSGLDLDLAAGEAAALTGPNGSGKTSLLRAVAGLVRPAEGTVAFGGVEPSEARARRLHYVGHQDGLKAARTVAEELAFWAAWFGGEAGRIAEAAEAFGLSGLLSLEVRRLSAGQRRRLAFARLLAAPRPLWLLDEPMAPLDAAWRDRFAEAMRRHLGEGGTILAAVHDPLPIDARAVELAA